MLYEIQCLSYKHLQDRDDEVLYETSTPVGIAFPRSISCTTLLPRRRTGPWTMATRHRGRCAGLRLALFRHSYERVQVVVLGPLQAGRNRLPHPPCEALAQPTISISGPDCDAQSGRGERWEWESPGATIKITSRLEREVERSPLSNRPTEGTGGQGKAAKTLPPVSAASPSKGSRRLGRPIFQTHDYL